jgi:hypothetical protein
VDGVGVTIGGTVGVAGVAFADVSAGKSGFSGCEGESEFPGEAVTAGETADNSGFFDSSALLHPIAGINTMKSNRKIILVNDLFTGNYLLNSLFIFHLNLKNPPVGVQGGFFMRLLIAHNYECFIINHFTGFCFRL